MPQFKSKFQIFLIQINQTYEIKIPKFKAKFNHLYLFESRSSSTSVHKWYPWTAVKSSYLQAHLQFMPHLHAQFRLVKAHQHVDNVKPRGRFILLVNSSNKCTQGLRKWEKEFFLERKSQNIKSTGSVASHCYLGTSSLHIWHSTTQTLELDLYEMNPEIKRGTATKTVVILFFVAFWPSSF